MAAFAYISKMEITLEIVVFVCGGCDKKVMLTNAVFALSVLIFTTNTFRVYLFLNFKCT